MVQIEIIGNLGDDVKRVDYQGSVFFTFNVCDNRKVNGQEQSMWYGCNLNRASDELLQFLVKGQGVFVRGIPRYRIFDSAVHHCKMVAVDILVNEIQLVGGSPASRQIPPDVQKKIDAFVGIVNILKGSGSKADKFNFMNKFIEDTLKVNAEAAAPEEAQQAQEETQVY